MKALLLTLPFLIAIAGPAHAAVLINEVRIDDNSTDTDEYFELTGTAGESLDGLTYIVIGDGTTLSGTIERVIDLTGLAIPTSGYFLAANSSLGTDVPFAGTIDLILSSNTFENSDNVTHLLVSGFTGSNGDDLDIDDDGTLDSTPWSSVVDGFSLVETIGSGDEYYAGSLSLPEIGPDGSFVPGHVFREFNGPTWGIGSFISAEDTPGFVNVPEPASVLLGSFGLLGLLRRRRA